MSPPSLAATPRFLSSLTERCGNARTVAPAWVATSRDPSLEPLSATITCTRTADVAAAMDSRQPLSRVASSRTGMTKLIAGAGSPAGGGVSRGGRGSVSLVVSVNCLLDPVVVAHSFEAGAPHCHGAGGVLEQVENRLRERGIVSTRHEKSVLVGLNNFRISANGCHHNWHSAGHRFKQRQRGGLAD